MIGMYDYSLINVTKSQQKIHRHSINAKLINIKIIIFSKPKQKYIYFSHVLDGKKTCQSKFLI